MLSRWKKPPLHFQRCCLAALRFGQTDAFTISGSWSQQCVASALESSPVSIHRPIFT
jgi:hypothetical protein